MADTIIYVDSLGGGDYTTLSSAVTAEYSSVSAGDRLIFEVSGPNIGGCSFSGGTNIGEVIVRAASGYRASADSIPDSSALIQGTDAIVLADPGVFIIEGITAYRSGGSCINSTNGDTQTTVKKCRFHGVTPESNFNIGVYTATASTGIKVENCIFDFGVYRGIRSNLGYINSYCCVFNNCYNAAIYEASANPNAMEAIDCCFYGCTVDDGGTHLLTGDYCAFDSVDSDFTNSFAVTDWNTLFDDPANDDFTPIEGSSLSGGIGPALNSDIPLDDMVDSERSGNTTYIGAIQFVSSSGNVSQTGFDGGFQDMVGGFY